MVALADRIRTSNRLAPTIPGARVATGEQEHAVFAREGDSWAVAFGTDAFQVRDSKGMHHLARLLRSPGREMHSLDLVRLDEPSTSRTLASAGGRAEADLEAGELSGTGPLLDAEAKAAYRERLALIGEEIAEAERWNDPERAARLNEERDALIHELAAAVGLGNRDRVSATSS